MPSHGREMRQNFNEYISKLFVRQQMKDESWESTIQSQKKNVFSFGKLCCSFSPWFLSPSPHLFPLTLRPFSHWEASDNLYCRHKYLFQVSSREYILSHASTLLGVLTLHASLHPHVSQASTQQNTYAGISQYRSA